MNTAIELTARENEIAELLAWGAAKKEVADRLYISPRTVENHTRNIFEKIGCGKVNELSACGSAEPLASRSTCRP